MRLPYWLIMGVCRNKIWFSELECSYILVIAGSYLWNVQTTLVLICYIENEYIELKFVFWYAKWLECSFYRCQFDPVNGGEMTQLEYHNFLKPEEAFWKLIICIFRCSFTCAQCSIYCCVFCFVFPPSFRIRLKSCCKYIY